MAISHAEPSPSHDTPATGGAVMVSARIPEHTGLPPLNDQSSRPGHVGGVRRQLAGR